MGWRPWGLKLHARFFVTVVCAAVVSQQEYASASVHLLLVCWQQDWYETCGRLGIFKTKYLENIGSSYRANRCCISMLGIFELFQVVSAKNEGISYNLLQAKDKLLHFSSQITPLLEKKNYLV